MRLIGLAVTLALGLTLAPLAAAQPPGKVPRVGFVLTQQASDPLALRLTEAFRQGLRERGYVDGQNVIIEYRWAEGRMDRFPGLAADLVRLNVDVIVVGATTAALAAKQATGTIPIVAGVMADPVGDGLVASLARPGGNITGFTFLAPELVPKRLQLLREVVPGVTRVAALQHPGVYGERTMRDMLTELGARAKASGVELQVFDARGPNDFDGAFTAMAKARAGALIILPSPMFYTNHRRLADLAAKHRLPTGYPFKEATEAGGLMSYGASIPDLFRRAAGHVDQILRGAKPADLPVEQPTKFELVINLKTAKALGLTIPQTVILQADQVIE